MRTSSKVVVALAFAVWAGSFAAALYCANWSPRRNSGPLFVAGWTGLVLCDAGGLAWVIWYGVRRTRARAARVLLAAPFYAFFCPYGPVAALFAWAFFYHWPRSERLDDLRWWHVIWILWSLSWPVTLIGALGHPASGHLTPAGKAFKDVCLASALAYYGVAILWLAVQSCRKARSVPTRRVLGAWGALVLLGTAGPVILAVCHYILRPSSGLPPPASNPGTPATGGSGGSRSGRAKARRSGSSTRSTIRSRCRR